MQGGATQPLAGPGPYTCIDLGRMSASTLLTSGRCVPEHVRTYNDAALRLLLDEAASFGESRSAWLSSSQRQHSREAADVEAAATSLHERALVQRAAKQAEAAAKSQEFRAATLRKQQATAAKEDEAFQATYAEVLEGLSNSSGIMGDTAYSLQHSNKIKHKKKSQLYDEWDQEVFGKIQGRLQAEVDSRSPRSIEARLAKQMSDYLHTTNTKLGVFRDVIIESDYDPLAAQSTAIRIATGDVRDPLKRDMLKPQLERQLMGLTSAADSMPLGKHTLDNRMWGALQIKSTPYGHCVNGVGEYIVTPQSAKVAHSRRSHVPMDHYDFPTTNEAAAAEVPKGKAIVGAPACLGGRQDLFDVMQNRCGSHPGVTGGDYFLEAKGKANAPGPEQRRGRKDLAHILQQAPLDGRTLGDNWMEAKGKQRVDGPEIQRGRADLFEVFQQSSNPYVDHRSLGNTWLDAKGRRVMHGPDNDVASILTDRCPQPSPPPSGSGKRSHSHLVPLGEQLTVE